MGTEDTRFEQYRDLLETWMKWWHGPAYDYGVHRLPVIPPVSNTEKALACNACANVHDPDGGRCQLCGREVRQ